LALNNPEEGILIPYLHCPSGSLASTESVDKLRETLAQVLRIPEDGNGSDEIVGMVWYETFHPEWDVSYDWDEIYYDEVFQMLIKVVKQHGVGDTGWASARWEVYDTVSVPLIWRLLILTVLKCIVCRLHLWDSVLQLEMGAVVW
jgi:hypothetical protein